MFDWNPIYIIVTIGVGVGSFIITTYWNKRNRDDHIKEDRRALEEDIQNDAIQKYKDDKSLAEDLLLKNKEVMELMQENLRDYIDKGDLDSKRELAYAVKLLEKDIAFLQQFIFGKESKSVPAYLTGEVETKEHDEAEGHGMFSDTEEEALEREGKE